MGCGQLNRIKGFVFFEPMLISLVAMEVVLGLSESSRFDIRSGNLKFALVAMTFEIGDCGRVAF